MAGKRQATSDLNHQNWDDEIEPEERGTFKTATAEELKTRTIKKAARRNIAGTTVVDRVVAGDGTADQAGKRSVFSEFSGFGKPTSSMQSGSQFAFLAKLPTVSSCDATKASFSFTTTSDTDQINKPTQFSLGGKMTKESTSTSLFGNTKVVKDTIEKITSAPTSIFGTTANKNSDDTAKSSSSPFTKPSFIMPIMKQSVQGNGPACGKEANFEGEYCKRVAELNFDVLDFIKQCLDNNPHCILTPIFDDYQKHLTQLQEKSKIGNESNSIVQVKVPNPPISAVSVTISSSSPSTSSSSTTSSTMSFMKKPNCTITSGTATTTATAPLFSFGSTQASPSASALTPSSNSIFSLNVAKPSVESKSPVTPKVGFFGLSTKDDGVNSDTNKSPLKTNGFSFGLKTGDGPSTSGLTFLKTPSETKMPVSTGFSFNQAATFSFGNVKPNPVADVASSPADEVEEDDTPPKVEFKQVVEEDAKYSKRCKVFVKKENDYADKGVGTLYLKPVNDSEKTQLLVRADTNLGNILVNLILNEAIPCKRMGKNNVMMVCLPTPEAAKTTILLRVKSGDEADELLEQINKHK